MIGFFILLFVMIGIWVIIIGSADTSNISKNWPKYRCNPTVMPFASFYGHDTTENFQYCMGAMMNNEMGGALAPVFQILATFLGTLATLVTVANNIRLEMATFMGGVNTIFQNFTDRFVQLSNNIRNSAQRIRMLMGRVYGTMFALIFMSFSATAALMNFGDTFLFKFLDTFCFNPDTEVELVGKGKVPVKDVKIGDVFTNGSKVTATFSFLSDGQPMVELPSDIQVSTNHYIQYKGKWIRSDAHPDARHIGPWLGGSERPLICFNTDDHRIPIGSYTFLDYDETDAADQDTMAWVESRVNGSPSANKSQQVYTTVFDPSTKIKLQSGETKEAKEISLGERLSTGTVIGIVHKGTNQTVRIPQGEQVSPGLLLWMPKANKWLRAGDVYPVEKIAESQYINFIVSPSACIETESGNVLRDYFEVHSPETEQFYAKAIEEASCVLAE
jgi:hypothetical protein